MAFRLLLIGIGTTTRHDDIAAVIVPSIPGDLIPAAGSDDDGETDYFYLW